MRSSCEPQRKKKRLAEQRDPFRYSQIFWGRGRGWGMEGTFCCDKTPKNAGSVTTNFLSQRTATSARNEGQFLRARNDNRNRKQMLTSRCREAFAHHGSLGACGLTVMWGTEDIILS